MTNNTVQRRIYVRQRAIAKGKLLRNRHLPSTIAARSMIDGILRSFEELKQRTIEKVVPKRAASRKPWGTLSPTALQLSIVGIGLLLRPTLVSGTC